MRQIKTLTSAIIGHQKIVSLVSSTKNTDTDISTNILDMELDLIDMEVFHFLGLDQEEMQ